MVSADNDNAYCPLSINHYVRSVERHGCMTSMIPVHPISYRQICLQSAYIWSLLLKFVSFV